MLLVALVRPMPARALSCKMPSALRLIYPGHNTVAPRNVVVYLTQHRYRQTISPRSVVLRDGTTKLAVAIRVLTASTSGLVRLVPIRPLAAGRKYFIYHGTRPVGLFRTSKVSQSAAKPRLGRRVKVRFGPVQRGRWVGRGRRARLELPRVKASHRPAVVQVDIILGKRRRSFGFSHSRVIHFANMGKCSLLGKMPPRGRYHLIVTPWSATGQQGRRRVLKGPIR